MRKFIFSVFDIVKGSTSEQGMVVDAPDESDTRYDMDWLDLAAGGLNPRRRRDLVFFFLTSDGRPS
jgi:hypothetical protein